VSITQVETTLVTSATTGVGGDHGDWVITGDVSRAQANAVNPTTGKLTVLGTNEGLRTNRKY
jgi:hypothetical protein